MDGIDRIFEKNREWAASKLAIQPDYFLSKADTQRPDFLWIGCSDSRVMANEITGLETGELLVHRNIANVVIHTDFNCLSVLHFGIEFLGIRKIIVCGHYNCGGIDAAMSPAPHGIADNWLRHVRDVYVANRKTLDPITDPRERANRLAELNVKWQVRNVVSTTVVQEAVSKGQHVEVVGLIYGLNNGLLTQLCSGDVKTGRWQDI